MNGLNWPAGLVVHSGSVYFPKGFTIRVDIAPFPGGCARTGKGERKRNRKSRWR